MLWLCLCFASLPILLLALLGLSSRLMGDDWCYFATGLWLSFSHNFGYWWDGWHGSYTFIVLQDILAPLGPEYMPPVFTTLNLLLWVIGLAWLASLFLRSVVTIRNQAGIAVILSMLTMSAVITALHSWEPLLWYSALVRHALPVGAFMIYLAAALEVSRRKRSKSAIWFTALAGGVVCFVIAGLSEFQVVYQLIVLSLLLAGVAAWKGPASRRQIIQVIALGWLACALSLMVQLSSPGPASRSAAAASLPDSNIIRSLPALALESFVKSLEYIGSAGVVTGLLLAVATGFVAAQLLYPARLKSNDGAFEWRASRIAIAPLIVAATAFGFLLLAVASAYFTIGLVAERGLTFATLVLALAGLAGGGFIGCWLQHKHGGTAQKPLWLTGSTWLGMTIIAALVISAAAQQARLLPDFAAFALQWDARHQRIVRLREAGERAIVTAPFEYHITAHISEYDLYAVGLPCQAYYYGVDSIRDLGR